MRRTRCTNQSEFPLTSTSSASNVLKPRVYAKETVRERQRKREKPARGANLIQILKSERKGERQLGKKKHVGWGDAMLGGL